MLVNLERARALMERYGLDALIATYVPNVFYLSEMPKHPICATPPCTCLCDVPVYVVLPFEKSIEPTIIAPMIQLDYYFASSSWIKDLRCYGEFYVFKAKDFDPAKLSPLENRLLKGSPEPREHTITEALVNVIDEKGLSKGKLGLDELGLTWGMFERIKRQLSSATILEASRIFYEIRLVKTSEEINRMRKAAEINVKALKAVLESVSTGVTEKELHEIYCSVVRKEGADPDYPIIAGGTRAGVPISPGWKPSERKLERGDIIRMDCDIKYLNYYSDIACTAVIGEASEKLKKYHTALCAGNEEAVRAIKPEEKASTIFHVAMKRIKKGIPHYRRPHVGHAIGIECYNPLVSLSPLCNFELQEGITINVEAPYYELGWGGMNVERTILITRSGCEDLASGFSTELYIL